VTFLGIDAGSSSIKAQTIDEEGSLLEFASHDVSDLLRRPQPTWAERDPATLWEAVCKTLRSMKHLDAVEALCVDATSGSVLAVGNELRLLSPILLYSDKRAQAETEHIREKSPEARAYEPYLPLDASLAIPKILWLKRNMPNFSKTRMVMNETDYIQARLAGQVYTSPSIAGKAHVDIRSGLYIEKIFDEVGIESSLLPPIRPIGFTLGRVSERASRDTGIRKDAAVTNGVTDATAADVATGTLAVGEVNVSIGSSLVVHAVTDMASPDHGKRIYYKSYVDGKILAGGATDAGTLPLSSLAKVLGKSVQELDGLAASVSPTCEGLLAQPQWIGSRIPYHNPRIRGFFVGITERAMSPGHLYRSLLEGNGFVLQQVLDVIQTVTGLELKEVRTSGGASRSDVQNQIIADITGRPVLAVETSEASLGSAMLALHSHGNRPPLGEVAGRVVKIRKNFTPTQDAHLAYLPALERFASITETLYGSG
jgi:sugar (pentulose or hexulose) kinase